MRRMPLEIALGRLDGGIRAEEHRLLVSGPTTGHQFRDVAFCDRSERATALARAANAYAPLIEALQLIEQMTTGRDEKLPQTIHEVAHAALIRANNTTGLNLNNEPAEAESCEVYNAPLSADG